MTKLVRRITILNILVFTISNLYNDIYFKLVLFPVNTEYHYTHQWITHQFSHGSVSHILFNMIGLLSFGPSVEEYFKGIWFYLLSGIFAAYLQLIFTPNVVLLGASGVVFAILIVFTLLKPNSKILLFFIIPIKAKWLVSAVIFFESYCSFRWCIIWFNFLFIK
jgi:membrane associated rhomboid family serine protease